MELTDSQILQRIESVYSPALDWQNCTYVMGNAELIEKLIDVYPELCLVNTFQILDLMRSNHFRYARNEHNGKRYWLLNDSVF